MFEEKDLVAMFGMFDVTGCGKISHTQVLVDIAQVLYGAPCTLHLECNT